MTVSEQIIQVINALCEKFGIVINWTEETVIPYITLLCKKLITYEIITSIALSVLMLILAITGTIIAKKLTPWFKEKIEEERETWDCFWQVWALLGMLAVVGLWIAFIAVSAVQSVDIIKCLTFPEMYVFEYMSALMAK